MNLKSVKRWLLKNGHKQIYQGKAEVSTLVVTDDGSAEIAVKDLGDLFVIEALPVSVKKHGDDSVVSTPIRIGEKKIMQVMTYSYGISMGWPGIHISIDPINGDISASTSMIKPEIVYDDEDQPESMRYRMDMMFMFLNYFIPGLLELLCSNIPPVELYNRQLAEIAKDKQCKGFYRGKIKYRSPRKGKSYGKEKK
jgi:hypothetical protein